MEWDFAFGLAAGLFVTNTLSYKVLHGAPWLVAMGAGLLSAVIALVLIFIFNRLWP